MPDKCCVPECSSNYESNKGGYVTVFRFPSDPEMHAKWVTCIPRKNWNPSKRSAVCINHFETDDVIKCDVYKDAESNEITFPRARPNLKDTAVPRLFPNLPKYLSKPAGSFSGIARTNPDDRRRKADEELQRKNEQWLADVISGFSDLCERRENKIRNLNKWQKVVFSDFVCFYQMCFEGIPKVVKSVKVDDTLSIQICVGNYIVSSSELKWILPSSLKLTRWSQLENILLRYVSIDSMNENSNEDSLVRLKQCLTFLEGKSFVRTLLTKLNRKYPFKHCVSMITSESCNSLYFDILNKGGLTAPSSNAVRVSHLAWSIMSALISEKFEAAFLKVRNHKQLFLQVLRQLVSSDIDLSFFGQDYCPCGKPLSDIREIILNTISNILINNYTKHKNDSLVHIQQTNKK